VKLARAYSANHLAIDYHRKRPLHFDEPRAVIAARALSGASSTDAVMAWSIRSSRMIQPIVDDRDDPAPMIALGLSFGFSHHFASRGDTSDYCEEALAISALLANSKARFRWSSILGRVCCANSLRPGSVPFWISYLKSAALPF
jgi:hypothetical protein